MYVCLCVCVCVCVCVLLAHTHTHTHTHFGISVVAFPSYFKGNAATTGPASVAMSTYVDETLLAGQKKYKLRRNWPGCEESDCRCVYWLPVKSFYMTFKPQISPFATNKITIAYCKSRALEV